MDISRFSRIEIGKGKFLIVPPSIEERIIANGCKCHKNGLDKWLLNILGILQNGGERIQIFIGTVNACGKRMTCTPMGVNPMTEKIPMSSLPAIRKNNAEMKCSA